MFLLKAGAAMDWNLAVEKNREALKRVLTMLVAMIQAAGCSVPAAVFPSTSALSQNPAAERLSAALTLPRHLHRLVLRLLRPAEAAARRLIILAARGLVVEPAPPRPRKPRPPSIFVRDGIGTGIVRRGSKPDRTPPRTLSLPLLDPLKRWGRRRWVKQRSVPRITFDFDRRREPAPPPPSPDDPLDAGRLHRRLDALVSALDNLPRQAKRFARWQARLDAASAQDGNDGAGTQGAGRVRRLSPMRPGRPPGWRRRPDHPVYAVLNELHGLAVWARERPNTS
jgi:hypothetical protein